MKLKKCLSSQKATDSAQPQVNVRLYNRLVYTKSRLHLSIFSNGSLVKLHIFQIKRSLTLDQKSHHGREHS